MIIICYIIIHFSPPPPPPPPLVVHVTHISIYWLLLLLLPRGQLVAWWITVCFIHNSFFPFALLFILFITRFSLTLSFGCVGVLHWIIALHSCYCARGRGPIRPLSFDCPFYNHVIYPGCPEIAPVLLWNCSGNDLILLDDFQKILCFVSRSCWMKPKLFRELLWNCSGIALELLWNYFEIAMKLMRTGEMFKWFCYAISWWK